MGLPCDFHLKLESETAIRWRRRHRWKKAGDREFWSSVPPVSASAPFSLVRASFFLDTIAFFLSSSLGSLYQFWGFFFFIHRIDLCRFWGFIISSRSSWVRKECVINYPNPKFLTELLCGRSWTINTKYYSADVSVWISHICDDHSLPQSHPLVALVMVFDLNEVWDSYIRLWVCDWLTPPPSSHLTLYPFFFFFLQLSTLVALQDWASHADISSFDILLCIGNKVDLVPHHPAHAEYRRRLSKAYSDIDDEFGISQSEGSSLLGSDDTSSLDIRGTCLDWCRDNNIEFIEACASNPDFDKCNKLHTILPSFLLRIDMIQGIKWTLAL